MLKRPITRCAFLFFSVCLTTMASRGVPTSPLVAGAQRPAAAQCLPASARSSDFVQPSTSDLVLSPSNASAGAPLAAGQALGLLSPLPGLTPTPVSPGVNGLMSPLPAASVASLLLPTATPLLGSIGVTAHWGALNPGAAASFAAVRAEVRAGTGIDALAVEADVLRRPDFHTTKPGVIDLSWHKAGRAVDLNIGGPYTVVSEANGYWRVLLGNVDVTAIFLSHGWDRIHGHDGVAEWWHFEYHPSRLGWAVAMRQVWPLAVLQQAYPNIPWASCPTGPLAPTSAALAVAAVVPTATGTTAPTATGTSAQTSVPATPTATATQAGVTPSLTASLQPATPTSTSTSAAPSPTSVPPTATQPPVAAAADAPTPTPVPA